MKTIANIIARHGLAGVLYAALAITLVGVPSLSYSQILEEIIVTAQKREQNIQDVGISITALSGNTLQELGLDNIQEISQ